ncbi:TPA: hypothetical protein TVL21_000545 [Streptococcus equi subsp. zooepidemicus]|nr:hypothetical protein [Streptococcus equi subsp. zooepidemicus]
MGRDLSVVIGKQIQIDFNPLARMGRDASSSTAGGDMDISIHSPVWGETLSERWQFTSKFISIHSPVWGETNKWQIQFLKDIFQSTRPYGARHVFYDIIYLLQYFNPLARMGRDLNDLNGNRVWYISIHSPVWGETLYAYIAKGD